MPERGAVRRLVLLLAAVGLTVVTAVPALAAAPPAAEGPVPRPVLGLDFPDPAVVTTPGGLVAYATGDRVPHAWSRRSDGPWRRGPALLSHRPSWSRDGGVWAVDVARVGGRWLLYYATPVRGMGEHGRCIGVARSASPRGPFRPVGRSPLVCPAYAGVPTAQDPLLPRDPTLPRAGVIDPSWYRDADGSSYLLYKTDRVPSSLRVVPLARDGQSVRRGAISVELLRSEGVLENPVLTRRAEGYVLLVSAGDWTRCGYSTWWLRSPALLDWSAPETGVLLDAATTGLCGPGGADLVEGRGGRTLTFLHGWTCHGAPLPCEGTGRWDVRPRARGVRAMYAARLAWVAGVPRVSGWLRPR